MKNPSYFINKVLIPECIKRNILVVNNGYLEVCLENQRESIYLPFMDFIFDKTKNYSKKNKILLYKHISKFFEKKYEYYLSGYFTNWLSDNGDEMTIIENNVHFAQCFMDEHEVYDSKKVKECIDSIMKDFGKFSKLNITEINFIIDCLELLNYEKYIPDLYKRKLHIINNQRIRNKLLENICSSYMFGIDGFPQDEKESIKYFEMRYPEIDEGLKYHLKKILFNRSSYSLFERCCMIILLKRLNIF
jgi:hypothetical protein